MVKLPRGCAASAGREQGRRSAASAARRTRGHRIASGTGVDRGCTSAMAPSRASAAAARGAWSGDHAVSPSRDRASHSPRRGHIALGRRDHPCVVRVGGLERPKPQRLLRHRTGTRQVTRPEARPGERICRFDSGRRGVGGLRQRHGARRVPVIRLEQRQVQVHRHAVGREQRLDVADQLVGGRRVVRATGRLLGLAQPHEQLRERHPDRGRGSRDRGVQVTPCRGHPREARQRERVTGRPVQRRL